MDQKDREAAKQLAEKHWKNIEELLMNHESEYMVGRIKFHFTFAFIHGYKHGVASKEGK